MLVDINLLPEKDKERSTLFIVGLALLGAGVLVWGVLLLLSKNLTVETDNLEFQLESLQVNQEEILSELKTTESGDEQMQLGLTVDWAEDYQFDTVPLLHNLIELLPSRGFFSTFDFSGPNFATVIVQFDTMPDAAYYLTRLKSSVLISEAVLDSVTVEEVEENHMSDAVLPRYLASYSIHFVDARTTIEETPESSDDHAEESETQGGTGSND